MAGVLPGFFLTLAWAIFLGAMMLSIALGIILSFHWFRYARNQTVSLVAALIYGGGCLFILSMLLSAVLTLK
ncbi:hypothetical protein A3A38_01380 [Candidatus Kaiserbacteria bacterium RIFCSPLOWO2_01_FULL_53_17]|uniref:Uncharacterized protein n=1 Tax=Candidatus Kaiserbacteria bacterium RIFCSPLOWO2_01_FULL_53_17 TaxID=1798511 RepID=A0A1F6EI53_9BACT|nr:MAG: hypothetical protein A3A38_01380 [Candidatus Kaiserbacteria bacterium RIFCSPLOWO2_01_FULL_53_17]